MVEAKCACGATMMFKNMKPGDIAEYVCSACEEKAKQDAKAKEEAAKKAEQDKKKRDEQLKKQVEESNRKEAAAKAKREAEKKLKAAKKAEAEKKAKESKEKLLVMENNPNIFQTSNLDLGAYLMLEGIKYLGCQIAIDPKRDEPKAMLKFLDDRKNCRDLERVFIGSREKRFREFNKFLLKDIHQEIKKFDKKLKNQIEE